MEKADAQLKIWNLKMLEQTLIDEGRSSAAYTIRQLLDLVSPNWRTAKGPMHIKVFYDVPSADLRDEGDEKQ